MIRTASLALFSTMFAATLAFSAPAAQPPLRVGIVGLVHGHVHGFLGQSLHSPEIEIVGVTEPDAGLDELMRFVPGPDLPTGGRSRRPP